MRVGDEHAPRRGSIADRRLFPLLSLAPLGQPLGYDILGSNQNIETINREDLLQYRAQNLHADKMVFAGAGAIDHDQLVELAQKHFAKFPTSGQPFGGKPRQKATFVGSEVRIRDDTWEDCHIAIAVEGVSNKHPDYWAMNVLASIMGNWDRSLGAAPLLSSKLTHIMSAGNYANSFRHFNLSYADTGLWGVHLVSENVRFDYAIGLVNISHSTDMFSCSRCSSPTSMRLFTGP